MPHLDKGALLLELLLCRHAREVRRNQLATAAPGRVAICFSKMQISTDLESQPHSVSRLQMIVINEAPRLHPH